MDEASPKRFKQLQSVWLDRLHVASEKYREASTGYANLSQEFRDGVPPSADGHMAIRQALAQQNSARQEYARVLRIFTDLLLSGVVPDEEASPDL